MSDTAASPSFGLSGKTTVVLMFVFGIVLTGILWTFWLFHAAPFAPLQKAIAAEFPKSSPRVDGGQKRMHVAGTPKLLWVIVRVYFEPEFDPERSQQVVERVTELTRQNLDVSEYSQLNVRLYSGEPEHMLHQLDTQVPLKP